tara:strand:- start:17 stop:166 length:150 start_codon:yes stop_codon:yes gene_type:complete
MGTKIHKLKEVSGGAKVLSGGKIGSMLGINVLARDMAATGKNRYNKNGM